MCVEGIAGGAVHMDYNCVPSVVYTHPVSTSLPLLPPPPLLQNKFNTPNVITKSRYRALVIPLLGWLLSICPFCPAAKNWLNRVLAGFNGKVPGARVHFSRHNSPNSRALADRSGRAALILEQGHSGQNQF